MFLDPASRFRQSVMVFHIPGQLLTTSSNEQGSEKQKPGDAEVGRLVGWGTRVNQLDLDLQ